MATAEVANLRLPEAATIGRMARRKNDIVGYVRVGLDSMVGMFFLGGCGGRRRHFRFGRDDVLSNGPGVIMKVMGNILKQENIE